MNIFEKGSRSFAEFRKIRDNNYHRLHSTGIEAIVRHIEVLTPADEQQLLQSGVVGIHSPLALLWAMFFLLMGKTFV